MLLSPDFAKLTSLGLIHNVVSTAVEPWEIDEGIIKAERISYHNFKGTNF